MSAPHRGLPPQAAMTLAQPPPPSGPSQLSPRLQHQTHPLQQQFQHQHQQQQPLQQQPLQQQPLQQPPPPPQAPPQQLPPAHVQTVLPSQLPPPPPWQIHGPDDTMRAWLIAKTEEEKRRAEEERTRQETLRLEQRRTEHDMLRTSIASGIPPPMVPVIFAGMSGGNLPQAALEWAHQIMFPHGPPPPSSLPPHMQQPHQQQPSHQQHIIAGPGMGDIHSPQEPQRPEPQSQHQPPPPRHQPPHPQTSSPPPPPPPPPPQPSQPQRQAPYGSYGSGSREGSVLGSSGGTSHAPGPSQGGPFLPPNPPSPKRSRGYTMPSSGMNRTAVASGGSASSGTPNAQALSAGAAQGTFGQQQLDLQASPPIYFHHWQPPSQGGASGSSSTPASAPVSESPKKRKASGQPAAPMPSAHQRFRSPPFSHSSSSLGNPPASRRRGHARQRSDISSYRGPGRAGYGGSAAAVAAGGSGGAGSASGHSRGMSPSPYSSAPPSATGSLREGEEGSGPSRTLQQPPSQLRSGGGHTVSSLLSEDPPLTSRPLYSQAHRESDRSARSSSERRRSPHHPGAEKGASTAGPSDAE